MGVLATDPVTGALAEFGAEELMVVLAGSAPLSHSACAIVKFNHDWSR